MDSVILTSKLIEPYKLIEDYQDENCNLKYSGGQSIFIGYMRETNQSRSDIISMKLDHYPEMTKKYLLKLTENIKNNYNLTNYDLSLYDSSFLLTYSTSLLGNGILCNRLQSLNYKILHLQIFLLILSFYFFSYFF